MSSERTFPGHHLFSRRRRRSRRFWSRLLPRFSWCWPTWCSLSRDFRVSRCSNRDGVSYFGQSSLVLDCHDKYISEMSKLDLKLLSRSVSGIPLQSLGPCAGENQQPIPSFITTLANKYGYKNLVCRQYYPVSRFRSKVGSGII